MQQIAESTDIEKTLQHYGVCAFKTHGTSMQPLLHTQKEVSIVKKPPEKLKKYDVALYRSRNGKYILHRVIKVTDDEYLIRGDNTFRIEHVKKSDVIGVLDSFIKNERQTSCDNKKYILYSRIWNFIYPVRYLCNFSRRVLSKIYRIFFNRHPQVKQIK